MMMKRRGSAAVSYKLHVCLQECIFQCFIQFTVGRVENMKAEVT